ncbi:LamG-like jellyroll fold domain-containing protein [Zunongwangia sp. H14]|uniref:LamG-like jellyroll fold domain-containing protein n=1 Tax=Zunongwangia sp. H14 TaxID=3240792 RepID=UPI00356A2339
MGEKLPFLKIFLTFCFCLLMFQMKAQCPSSVGVTSDQGLTICQGTSVTFTANPSGGTNLSYAWTLNGAPAGSNSPSFTPTSLASNDKIQVTVTSADNTSCSKASSVLTMTVNANRTGTLQIQASNSNICPGETVNFVISSITNGGSNPTYDWKLTRNSTTSSVGSTSSFSSSNLQNGDKIQLFVKSSVPCTPDFSSNIITISEKPGPPAQPGNISGETAVCPGASVTYTIANVSNASGYLWSLPQGWTGNSSSTSITVVAGNNGGNITVSAQNSCGTGISQTLPVTVKSGTPSRPAPVSGATSVCPSTSETYEISPVSGASEYIWTLPDGSTQRTSATSIQVNTNSSGNSNVSVQATNDCGTSTKYTWNVSIKPGTPVMPGTITGNNAICPGTSATYSISAVSGASSYEWTLPNGWSGSSTGTSITATAGASGNGNISVRAINDCGTGPVQTLAVTVKDGTPNTPGTIGGSTTVCPNTSEIYSITPVAGASEYVWVLPSGWSGSSTSESITVTTGSSGSGSISVRAKNDCGTSTARTLAVGVSKPAPVMSGTITGPVEVCTGTTNLTYSIPAITNATSYEWTVPNGWAITSGATSNSIRVTAGSSGNISVIARNSCGDSSPSQSFSVQATNGVPATPTAITAVDGQNRPVAAVCPPATGLVFSVPANPNAKSYVWTLPQGWEITSGVNTNAITVRVNASALETNNASVSVKAINICGSSPSVSYSGITVRNHVEANIGPDQTVCKSRNPITIVATIGFNKRLKVDKVTSTGSGNISGVPNGNTEGFPFTYTPSQSDLNLSQVKINLTTDAPSGACGPGGDEMIIFFTPDATINNPSNKNQAVCINSAIAPIGFAIGGGATGASVTGLPAGLTGNFSNGNFTISGSPSSAGSFNYIVNTTGPCTQTSQTGTITVNPYPTVNKPTNIAACNNSNVAAIAFSGSSVSGTSYSWTNNTPSIGLAAGGTGNIPSFMAINSGNTPKVATITVTPTANNCTGTSETFTITVNPSAAFSTPIDVTVCNNATVPVINFSGSNVSGTSFSWTNDNPSIGLAGSGTGNIASFSAKNTTATSQVANITVIPMANNCEGIAQSFKITVNPTPTVNKPADIISCNNGSVSEIVFSGSSVSGTTYKWTNDKPSIGLAAAGTGNIPVFTPLNTGNAPITATVTVTPEANGCSGAAETFKITVNPTPSVNLPADVYACNGGSVSEITFTGNVSGSTFSWTNDSPGIGLSANGTGNIPSFTAVNTSATAIVATITITPEANSCQGNAKSFTITVNPNAVVDAGPDQTICSNTTAGMAATLGGGASTGTWTTSGSGSFSNNSANAIYTPSAIDVQNGEVTLTFTTNDPDGPCQAVSDSMKLTINKEVVITTQPFDVGVCSTRNEELIVVATGSNLQYQWFKNGTAVPGATSAILSFNNAQPADSGSYYVEVSGESACGAPVKSDEVIFNVDENILVNTQPVSQDLCENENLSLSISATATGGNPGFRWRKDGVELSDNSRISGATTANLNISNLTAADAGNYDVIIDGPAGYTCDTGYSTIAKITVSEEPTIAVGNNLERCYTSGAINIGADASGSNYSAVLWTHNGTGSISSATSLTEATYTPGSNESGDVMLTLTLSGNASCVEASKSKILTIVPQPVITSFTYAAAEFCETDANVKEPSVLGSNFILEEGSFSVQPATGLSIDLQNGKITPNASTPGEYVITYSTSATATCAAVTAIFNLAIGEEPDATFGYDQDILCKDTRDNNQNSNPVISFAESGHENVDSFSATPAGLDLDVSDGAINLGNSAPGTYTITRSVDYTGTSEDGCAAVSASVNITVSEKPIPDFSYTASEYCSNASNPVAELAAGGQAGIFSADNAGLVFVNTSTGEINLAASTPGTYTVTNTIDLQNDGCAEVSFDFEITVTQLPVANFSYSSNAFCQDSATDPAPVLNGTAGTFTAPPGLVINPATGVIDISASTPNSSDPNDVYTVTNTIPASGGCSEVTAQFNVRIDPVPVGGELTFDVAGNPNSYLICYDATSNFLVNIVASGYTGTIKDWQKFNPQTNTWIPVSGNGNPYTSDTFNNYGSINGTTMFRAVIQSGSCGQLAYSKMAVVNVIPDDIKPSPVEASADIVCLGEDVLLTSQSGYASGSYITSGDFNNANPEGWIVDGSTSNNFPANGNNTKPNRWSETNDHPFDTRDGSKVFDAKDGKFAIVSGQNLSTLESPVFNTFGLSTASLRFDEAFIMGPNSKMKIELSLDGGSSYNIVLRNGAYGIDASGVARTNNYQDFSGSNQVIDLSDYVGQPRLRVRFTFDGRNDPPRSIWALDNITLPDKPINVAIEWTDEDGVEIGSTENITVTPDKPGVNTFYVTSYILLDDNGNECRSSGGNTTSISVFAFDNYTAEAQLAPNQNFTCGLNTVKLNAKIISRYYAGEVEEFAQDDNSTARWSVSGLTQAQSDAYFSDPTDPNATFTAPSATTPYVINWSITPDSRSTCPPSSAAVEVVFTDCTTLDFDGVDDYVDLGKSYNAAYSIEAWVRPEAASGFIWSGPGYQLLIENNKPVFKAGTARITSANSIAANGRWYHVAVSYDGSNATMYIDGLKVANGNVPFSPNNENFLIGARYDSGTGDIDTFFTGWIEEVRIWNTVLSVDQVRFMMNQRLYNNGTKMGVEIPMDVPGGLSFANLAGYYQLNTANIGGGFTPDLSSSAVNGRLHNMNTLQENTAPLPYISNTDGKWTTNSTWLRPTVWDIPNGQGVTGDPIDWNIVKLQNNISSDAKDITVLGLKSESGKLTVANPSQANNESNSGQMLRVTHYLLLNGNIDLTGESQLLQDEGSLLAESSTGWLERDQQGTRSSFNYNYWSSPVSAQGTANNSDYTIAQILRDGTNSNNPQIINFRPGHEAADGARSNPITTSEYWLWRFNGTSDVYEEWVHIGSSGSLKTGEGFTMKGTDGNAAISDRQNYVFKGKPHNGDFTLAVGMDKNYLIGNPYPSAMDAREFILDNLNQSDVAGARNTKNVFNGVVYFWDHFAGHTHILREYVGGYAAFTLAGAVPAVSIDERINDNEAQGTKIPQQYIPVGQGFFINTGLDISSGGAGGTGINVNAGNIIFKNSQREGIRESSSNSIFLKPIYPTKTSKAKKDERAKIRMRFDSPKGYHRQILVTADPVTTENVDLGYDAPLIEYNLDDMYWLINQREYVIQAVPDFGPERILPLGIQLEEKGEFTIAIDSTENMDKNYKIYLRDQLNDSIHDFADGAYHAEAESGFADERFSVIFYKKQTPVPVPDEEEEEEESPYSTVHIDYNMNTRELKVYNPELIKIDDVIIFDLTGRTVQHFDDVATEKEVILPVKQFPAAVYIVKLIGAKGKENKKMIMK